MNAHSRSDENTSSPVRIRLVDWLSRKLLASFVDRVDGGLVAGSISVQFPDGAIRRLGGTGEGPAATLEIRRWRAIVRLILDGSPGWYEAWAAGDWASPDPVPLFDLFMRNRHTLGNAGRAAGFSRLLGRLRHWQRRNSRAGARRNIAAHYDLGNDFYSAWLDPGMTYSSALFSEPLDPGEPLQAAQDRKLDRLIGALALAPQSELLEIGFGWGYLSRKCAVLGHKVTGITLSPRQLAWAEEKARGLVPRPRYLLCDYRDMEGQFDALLSVEMVEAVGQAYWPDYFAAAARMLKPGGRFGLQYIAIDDAIFDAYARNVDFIQTYIFPGGLLISESRFRALAAENGLQWGEPFRFGLHYAETLKRWREAFEAAARQGRIPSQFDARFIGLWRYYLMYCEGGFRSGGIFVAQVVLTKPQ